jgi:hypothetical protein
MTEGFGSIITQLERQKTAIDRALVALREVDGIGALPASPTSASPSETSQRKGMKRSAAVRERMKEAQQLRWAKIRGESVPPAPATPELPTPKRHISDQGMKRIIAATKKRWALKRAADTAALKQAKPRDIALKKAAVTAFPARTVKKGLLVRKAAGKNSDKAPV